MKPRVEVFKGADGWRWHVRAANGQITATSGEAFASRSNARRAAKAFVASLAADAGSDYGTTVAPI